MPIIFSEDSMGYVVREYLDDYLEIHDIDLTPEEQEELENMIANHIYDTMDEVVRDFMPVVLKNREG